MTEQIRFIVETSNDSDLLFNLINHAKNLISQGISRNQLYLLHSDVFMDIDPDDEFAYSTMEDILTQICEIGVFYDTPIN
jgi:hypothetical protein